MTSNTRTLSGPAAWWDTLVAASQKELIIMTRYPVEFIASFAQVFLIVVILTLAGLMFAKGGAQASGNSNTAGVVVSGFIMYMFFEGTMWNIGYNVRREQKQGTLEQLYLSPATKSITLLSSIAVMMVWRGLLCLGSAAIMGLMLGRLPFHNPALSLLVLALSLSGTFGAGFAFAALTLRVRETGQTIASLFQVLYMVLCAPFFPFAALPEWLKALSRLLPFAYGVDAFRSTLLGFPNGYPELAPLNVELAIVIAFGLVMPVLGFWLYQREENRARARGSLSEY
jgi:ABC-2 type transport system permease protein